MARDSRITGEDNQPIAFTCRNRRFETNIRKGEPHKPFADTLGSVFPEPLIDHDGYTLWIEHVWEPETDAEYYWLMWYNPEGIPTIPLSGVFDRTDLEAMVSRLARLVP